jgi:[ribosomal protein S5]-alanine N-acetyltransferase
MDLYTARFHLREIVEEDFAGLYELYHDDEGQRYEGEAQDEGGVRARLANILERKEKTPRRFYPIAITRPGEERMLGWVKLELINPTIREYEMGWIVRRQDWGQGCASEAAREVQRFAFTQLQAHRVVAFCHARNRASERVMEKLGMHREGLLRETRWIDYAWSDELLYAILEHEFVV